jgi:hypothetical protein
MPYLSPQLREAAKAMFTGEDKDHPPCQDCGGVHARACPRIAKLHTVVNGDGIVTERTVEYWAPGSWESHGIIFPEDVYDDDDASSGN